MNILRKVGLVTVKDFNRERAIIERIWTEKLEEYKVKQKQVIRDYESSEADLRSRIDNQSETISSLKAELKRVKGAKGGLTKKINELTRENEELRKKLEESMTDKYLVKKVKSGRTPNTQQMKIKHTGVESRIIKKMKEGI